MWTYYFSIRLLLLNYVGALNVVSQIINNSWRLNKRNHNLKVFVYLTIIGIDILRFNFFPFYLVLASIEKIYQIFKSVWPHFQTHRSSSKILRCPSYFQLSSRCLEMWLNTVFYVRYIRSINLSFARLSSYITLSMAQVLTRSTKRKSYTPFYTVRETITTSSKSSFKSDRITDSYFPIKH